MKVFEFYSVALNRNRPKKIVITVFATNTFIQIFLLTLSTILFWLVDYMEEYKNMVSQTNQLNRKEARTDEDSRDEILWKFDFLKISYQFDCQEVARGGTVPPHND